MFMTTPPVFGNFVYPQRFHHQAGTGCSIWLQLEHRPSFPCSVDVIGKITKLYREAIPASPMNTTPFKIASAFNADAAGGLMNAEPGEVARNCPCAPRRP